MHEAIPPSSALVFIVIRHGGSFSFTLLFKCIIIAASASYVSTARSHIGFHTTVKIIYNVSHSDDFLSKDNASNFCETRSASSKYNREVRWATA
jgi:hypothetical protein